MKAGQFYDYPGVIHCHSHYSDGTGSLEEIAQAARDCSLKYVIMTDHNTFLPREIIGDGWYKGVLFLIGQEISPVKNHYLALNLSKPIFWEEIPPKNFVQVVRDNGGMGVIAHPHDRGNPFFGVPPFPWEDLSMKGIENVELWNFFSDLGNRMTSWYRALIGYFFPWYLVEGPPQPLLDWWDRRSQDRPITALGGLDAHGIRIFVGGIPLVFFPYRRFFRTLRTHVLTTEPFRGKLARDRKLLLDNLAQGHCYISFDLLGDPQGFSFTLQTGSQILSMGSELESPPTGHFQVSVPSKGLIRFRRNGILLQETWGLQLEVPVGCPGVYRVEVFRRKGRRLCPWIFSNPIYLRKGGSKSNWEGKEHEDPFDKR